MRSLIIREPTSCCLVLSFNLVGHRLLAICCLIEQRIDSPVYTVVILTYSFCGIEYYLRYSKNSPITSHSDKEANSSTIFRGTCTKRLKHMAYALVFMTTCLFVRYVWSESDFISRDIILKSMLPYLNLSAIYRTIELSGGWNGRIISTQVYFSMFFCIFLFTCHAYLILVSRCFRWCNGHFGGLYNEPCTPREIVGCAIRR